jgi:flagellar biosynthesis GTPase FlhF
MLIANPMYDVVFKFLLEDQSVAKLLIGTIIGEEILSLEFRPQERSHQVDAGGERFLTVYRMDFAARIRNAQGEERQVLIELQKAKFPTDIMRFRRYLGSQYRDPDNTRLVNLDEAKNRQVRQGLPLLTIYFLGHRLEHSTAPIIRVRRDIVDLTTGEPLTEKEPFIEGLTHDSYIIQIPELHRERRTEVEQMLQIFDQGRIIDDHHVLELREAEVPPIYRPLIRRLQLAYAEREIAEVMELEDEILDELREHERAQEWLRQQAEQAQAQAEQAQAQAEQAQAQVEQAQAQVEQAQAQVEQAQAQIEQVRTQAELARTQAELAQADAARERARNEQLLALLKQAGIEPDRTSD